MPAPTIVRLASWGRPYLARFAIGLLLLLVTNGLNLWIPWLLRDAIRAMERRAPLSTVAGLAAAMVGIALLQAGVRTVSRWAILGASRRIVYDIRNAFFAQLQRLDADWYDLHRTGDIMSRGVNDTRQIQGFFGPGLMNLLNTTIVYVAVIALLLRIDATLTLISLVLYPVLFVGVNRLSRAVYARSIAVQEQLGTISNRAQENISGIQQVKIYTQEQREIEVFNALCDEHRRRNLSMATVRGAMISLIGIVSGLGTLIVLVIGGRFVVEGRIGFGDFVAFNAYLAMLVWPTIAFGWIINTIQRGLGAMGRIEEVLAREPSVPAATDEGLEIESLEPLDGDIEIRDLHFAYPSAPPEPGDGVSGPGGDGPPASRDVLCGIDLSIPRGSRVALVGPVGSGKSTLANLLARLYPVPPASIFIDGRDIAELPVTRLRRSVGYVPQEAFLFSRPLRENIAFGMPGADEESLARALRLAQFDRDVAAFPDGLDTVVGERGFTLSGGQRQRATLARAVVDPERRILILDDSLASVDSDTEASILRELGERGDGRTLILITHRLSTLAGMDRIVVLDAGRVVEQGRHEELLQHDGLYARLHRRYALEQRLTGS